LPVIDAVGMEAHGAPGAKAGAAGEWSAADALAQKVMERAGVDR